MISRAATHEDAIALAKDMASALPNLAKKNPATRTGRTEWTRAIWRYFDEQFRQKYGWDLYPKSEPIKGRVDGEFVTDFSLFDNRRGYRIACESEWGDIDRIDWAFDKLRSVKAELKILIFESGHTDEEEFPLEIGKRIRNYLANCGQHNVGREFYLFLQFEEERSRLYLWEPTSPEPCEPENIRILAI
jgi:hypothetical protein